MQLSRFWSALILLSLISLIWGLASGSLYSLDSVLNGKQKDKRLIQERSLAEVPSALKSELEVLKQSSPDGKGLRAVRLSTLRILQSSTRSDSVTQIDLRTLDVSGKVVLQSDTQVWTKKSRAQYGRGLTFYFEEQPEGFRLRGFAVQGKTQDAASLNRFNQVPLASSSLGLFQRIAQDEQTLLNPTDSLLELNSEGKVSIYSGGVQADGLFTICKWVVFEIWLPLLGIMVFLTGLMGLLQVSKAGELLSELLSPFFTRIFPSLPTGSPAFQYMTLNFAANFLGLDNAATPFGLKAMEEMQKSNPKPEVASDAQILFLCLHAAGLTLIPTSIIGYRAAMNASSPTDVMIPIVLTSFIGTLAALFMVSWRQKINLFQRQIFLPLFCISLLIAVLVGVMSSLSDIARNHLASTLGAGIFLLTIFAIVGYSQIREYRFRLAGTNLFGAFVEHAKEGWETCLRILPYMIAMMAAISLFRNSGLMQLVLEGMVGFFGFLGVDERITQALPVALLRPFSAGGARGFMFDAMRNFGPDSLTGRLACLFEGAAETTFYILALYFGSVRVRDTRYTLSVMLLTDFVCVVTAVVVCWFWFT